MKILMSLKIMIVSYKLKEDKVLLKINLNKDIDISLLVMLQ